MRLKYRLSFLFIVVLGIGAATTFLLVRHSTESVFRSFVFSGDAEKAKAYASILAEYRLEKGGWTGVQDFLADLPPLMSRMLDTRIHGEEDWPAMGDQGANTFRSLLSDRVVVADSRGLIVADTAWQLIGTLHPARHLDHGVSITADFARVGTVLVGSMIDSSLNGIDERFLASVMASLFWSSSGSAALALLVGLLFAARITRPLGVLALAATRVASGDYARPVPVVGGDEVADLSISFNEMIAELKRLDAAKKQVIADAAHELRTPLTLIQGTIEGMIDGVLPMDPPTLESVHEETLKLARLIDTLRELEIIESGELELSLQDLDLCEAIRKAMALFSRAARQKSIALAFESSGPEPLFLRGDYLRLGEVIYNLISNAIRYTPEGGTVFLRTQKAGDAWAEFSVEDSGPGVPPEERGKVFERFYRMDKSRAAESGGRGLGLAIASEIVKAHGGSISIEDAEIGGARFVVRLPVLNTTLPRP